MNCLEGLELPGVPSDYHFMIQSTVGELWKRRREEPAGISDVERLCWLDLDLIDARPDCVTYENDEGSSFYAIAGFGMLINLFEREGALHEALEVAQRAERFGQGAQEQRSSLSASRPSGAKHMGEAGGAPLWATLTSSSFLEYAFLRWVLTPAVGPVSPATFAPRAGVEGRTQLPSTTRSEDPKTRRAVELDGFEFHGPPCLQLRPAPPERSRGTGRDVLRFSYDSIRHDTARCVAQLQAISSSIRPWRQLSSPSPVVEVPEMDPDPLFALRPSPANPEPSTVEGSVSTYFDVRRRQLQPGDAAPVPVRGLRCAGQLLRLGRDRRRRA